MQGHLLPSFWPCELNLQYYKTSHLTLLYVNDLCCDWLTLWLLKTLKIDILYSTYWLCWFIMLFSGDSTSCIILYLCSGLFKPPVLRICCCFCEDDEYCVFASRQPLSLDQDSSVCGDQQLTLELKVTFAWVTQWGSYWNIYCSLPLLKSAWSCVSLLSIVRYIRVKQLLEQKQM